MVVPTGKNLKYSNSENLILLVKTIEVFFSQHESMRLITSRYFSYQQGMRVITSQRIEHVLNCSRPFSYYSRPFFYI